MLIRQETLQFPFLGEIWSDSQRMGDYAGIAKGEGINGGFLLLPFVLSNGELARRNGQMAGERYVSHRGHRVLDANPFAAASNQAAALQVQDPCALGRGALGLNCSARSSFSSIVVFRGTGRE